MTNSPGIIIMNFSILLTKLYKYGWNITRVVFIHKTTNQIFVHIKNALFSADHIKAQQ